MDTQVGANLPMKRDLGSKWGVGTKHGTTAFLFEPQPRFAEVCARKAKELGLTTCLPYAAWIRNETMTFNVHDDAAGMGSSLFNSSVFVTQGASRLQVQAIDLAEWMQLHIPRGADLTGHFDVEGAEYVLMRHLMLRGQACRFRHVEFEAHALYNRDHAPLRAFDVLLPWLLQGCERPPKVKVLRYYGTPNSVHFGGKPQMEKRIRSWTAGVEPESWCESCTLLDKMVEPSLGDVANA